MLLEVKNLKTYFHADEFVNKAVDDVSFSIEEGKTVFFVSLFSPSYELTSLTEGKHWTILLEEKDKKLKPYSVTKVHAKNKWSHFFPFISPWSQEFIIVFNKEENDKTAFENKKNLILSHAKAETSMRW